MITKMFEVIMREKREASFITNIFYLCKNFVWKLHFLFKIKDALNTIFYKLVKYFVIVVVISSFSINF